MALSISNTASYFNPSSLGSPSKFGVKTTTPSSTYVPPKPAAPASVANAPQPGLVSSSTPPAYVPPVNTYVSSTANSTNTPYVAPITAAAPSTRGLFGDIASSLAGQGTAPNPAAQGYTQQAAAYGAGAIPIAAQGKDIAAEYGKKYTDLGVKGANFEAGQLTTGTSPVAEGNAAVTAQTTAAQQAAVAAGQQAALKGVELQLTGQEQAANAANSAATQSYTGQGLQQSALTSAGGLVKPSPAAYGQTVFNPATGTYDSNGGNLDPQTVAPSLAQKVLSKQMTYEQAVASLGYAGSAGQQFLNDAIHAINPNFNAPLSSATIQGQQDVYGNLPAMQSANIAADGIKGKVITYLAANPTINATNLAAGNTLQQWIKGQQLTDPKYQTLANLLDEYTNTLAPVLGVGGNPTNLKTQIAQGFINGAASGKSIAQVLDDMQQLAAGKISDLQSGATGGGVVSSPHLGPTTSGGSKYSF